MTKANSENCYWKVQFFLSHRAVNYACIVLIHRLNRAHTNTNTHTRYTHTNTHIVLVCCVSACVPKKEAKRGVSASCIGLLLWLYALFHAHTRTLIQLVQHTHSHAHHIHNKNDCIGKRCQASHALPAVDGWVWSYEADVTIQIPKLNTHTGTHTYIRTLSMR